MTGRSAGTLAERRYADVRLSVAEAARDLFVESRSTAVTVGAIAQRAGVSERTFYRHFPTKADVVIPLLERSTSRLLDSLRNSDPESVGVVHALVDTLTEEITSAAENWQGFVDLIAQTPEYRLRWERIDDSVVDELTGWLADNSSCAGDAFSCRVTALLILTASRAAYSEWSPHTADAGIAELRALHFRALEAIVLG